MSLCGVVRGGFQTPTLAGTSTGNGGDPGDRLGKAEEHVKGVLVVRNGYVVFENYYQGHDRGDHHDASGP